MKITTLILAIVATINTVACGNSAANNANTTNTTTEIGSETTDNIIGTWIPIALDFNLDGKTEPIGNWKYHNKKDEENVKAAGMEIEFGNFTFNANGTGYLGKTETANNTFKWRKMANGKVTIDDGEIKNTNAENIEEFYIDTKGQLIFHHSEKPLIMGKEVIQNSFELYKRN